MLAGREEYSYPRVFAIEIRGKTLRLRKESHPDLSFHRATSRQQITAKPSIYARDTPPKAGVLGAALGALRTGTLPGRTGENRLTLFLTPRPVDRQTPSFLHCACREKVRAESLRSNASSWAGLTSAVRYHSLSPTHRRPRSNGNDYQCRSAHASTNN